MPVRSTIGPIAWRYRSMRTEIENGKLIAYLEGKINSTNAMEIQQKLENIIDENPGLELAIDAGALDYVSSAGLRVFQKLLKDQGGLTVRNVSQEIFEILEMTGFTSLIDVRKRLREISVEGCEIVGRGAIGTVYRMDEDTIVKVYEIPDSLPMIENEQKRAKQAFLKGIPTAISYDVVKVGDKYGSVFELLKACTYNDLIIAHPERREEIIRQYARFIRQLHAVEMDRGDLPEAKAVFLDYLEDLRDILPEALRGRLIALFEAMPEDLHVVHGDIQMKNVMLSGKEPILIDMDTLSVGDPVFDLMSLYLAYVQFCLDDPGNSQGFFGLPEDVSMSIWDKTVQYYFEDLDEAGRREAEDRIIVVALVRFLFLITVLKIGKPELKEVRIRHAVEHLEALAQHVTSLAIRSL